MIQIQGSFGLTIINLMSFYNFYGYPQLVTWFMVPTMPDPLQGANAYAIPVIVPSPILDSSASTSRIQTPSV